MLSKSKRIIALILIMSMVFSVNVKAFAQENNFNSIISENSEEIEKALENIMDYSVYDRTSNTWILNHAIVEDGVFTEEQYNNAEEAGSYWMEVEEKYNISNENGSRALPALLVVAIKAVGAVVGTTIVAEMTRYFLKWGLKSGCKKFKKYAPIKSFCKANGYL